MMDQERLDELYGACLDLALFLLEKNGEFYPLACEMSPSGEITPVAVSPENDKPDSQEIVNDLQSIMTDRARAGQIAACAIAIDIRVQSEPDAPARDAIQIRLRAPDYARDVIVPYSVETSGFLRRKRKLVIDTQTAAEAENDIFQ